MNTDQTPATTPIDHQLAESWLTTLQTSARFDAPWVAEAVAWLIDSARGDASLADADRPPSVIDVGCGAGGAAVAFAGTTQAARVVATDRDPRLVDIARGRAATAGVGSRIRGVVANVDALPLRPGSADLVWASGVVHHLPDQQAAVDALAELARPGGRLALVEGGLPLRCLPYDIGVGRPGLESRLDGARTRWFMDLRAELAGPSLPYGWPEVLARAGLVDVRARSFVAELTPPLDDLGRRVVEQHLMSALTELGDRLDPADRATLGRLLDRHSSDYVGHRDDLMVTAVRTVHAGTVGVSARIS